MTDEHQLQTPSFLSELSTRRAADLVVAQDESIIKPDCTASDPSVVCLTLISFSRGLVAHQFHVRNDGAALRCPSSASFLAFSGVVMGP